MRSTHKTLTGHVKVRATFAAIAGAVALVMTGLASADDSAQPVRPVHRFLEISVSPDGAFVASVEGDAPASGGPPQVRDLVIRRVATGAASTVVVPCGRVPECWPASPIWAPDGAHVTFALRKPGSHARSVYSVAADGSALTRLLAFEGTITALSYGPGGRLAMLAIENANKEVGATQAGAPVAGDMDEAPREQRIAILEGDTVHWASPPDLFVYEYDWQPDGKGFIATAAPGDGDNNWWHARLYDFRVDAAAGRILYSPADIRQQITAPRLSPDGTTVAFIAGIMSDFGSTGGDIYTVPLAGGPATNITPEMRASARALAWGCDGHLHAELLAVDRTQIVDFGDGRHAAAGTILWSGSESLSGRDAGVSQACPSQVTATAHESFTVPPEIQVGAIGRWHDLTTSNAGMTMPLRAQSLSWKSDGFDVQGWLLLPEHRKGTLPMVTRVHGGPAAAAQPVFAGPGLTRTLLERGYALFLPNPRGSFGQGERFTAANVRDLGHGDLRDILSGVDAAMKLAPIDGERLGITGGSYGGFMTMWAVTQTNRFKAGVAAAGISDWQSYYGENGIDAWMLPYFGASVYDDPAVYARSSPITFIRNVHTPVFAYVGERDIECPASQTREFWHALKALGVPTSSVIYPGEGHGLREPAHIEDADHRTLAWFERYLQ
jgi:dipeptidyl aminopeptidase/acylaminoacyl peptidase